MNFDVEQPWRTEVYTQVGTLHSLQLVSCGEAEPHMRLGWGGAIEFWFDGFGQKQTRVQVISVDSNGLMTWRDWLAF